MTAALLEARGLSLSFGTLPVLQNVSLSLNAGRIVTLIGPNGSGKTTLLRALIGLQAVDRGEVVRRTGLRIGYMPQKLKIDPVLPLTVKRFLTLTAPAPIGARRAALEEVGAARLIDAPVQALSGGELQRVMLARALLRQPDLLVLDEPAQGVDAGGQRALYRLIDDIRRRRGCAVLMVSHDLHLVMAQTDLVVCFHHHICCSGPPERVERDPAYGALFGRDTLAGLAVYAHHHDHGHDLHGQVVAPNPSQSPAHDR